MSSGLRLVTRLLSTTTSSSVHVAPALRMSVCSDGHEVMWRPLSTSASISIIGPWHMAATGLLLSKNVRTNLTALGSVRSLSGFITPPGNRSASYSSGFALSSDRSTGTSSPQSLNFQPRIEPVLGAMTTVFAPAASSALRGSVSSDCSKPSVARIATRLPFNVSALLLCLLRSMLRLLSRHDAHHAPDEKTNEALTRTMGSIQGATVRATRRVPRPRTPAETYSAAMVATGGPYG